MFGNNNSQHEDDYFAPTRMSFGDHIEELRWHLIRAIAGFLVAFFFSFFIGWWVLEWIQQPATDRRRRCGEPKKARRATLSLVAISIRQTGPDPHGQGDQGKGKNEQGVFDSNRR